MTIKRRKFLKSLSLSTIYPLVNIELSIFSNPNSSRVKEFYQKAIVIDGLIIPRGWNEDSFKALDESRGIPVSAHHCLQRILKLRCHLY